MAILSAQSIRQYVNTHKMIYPFEDTEQILDGVTYGLGPAGYSVRLINGLKLKPGHSAIVQIQEYLHIPHNIKGVVADKSYWARQMLSVFNTRIQPGWEGNLVIKLINKGPLTLEFTVEMGIAEIEFHELDYPTTKPYVGKYQHQGM